jgi:hypothetical protein
MLAGSFQVGERIASGPAAAWYRDALWLAYAASDGMLVVRSLDVLGDARQGVRRDTGRPCGGLTATAVQGDRLYVLFGTPGEAHRLTWTADGVTFAPPVTVPILGGHTGIGGMAAYSGGLAILWAENIGGRAHLLTSADGGATFGDTVLPFAATAEPGVCYDEHTGRLLYGYDSRSGGPGSFTLAAAEPSAPATLLETATAATPLRGRHVCLCPVEYRNRPGLHVTASELTDEWLGPVVVRTATANLSTIGGEEPFGGTAQALSVAFDGHRAWAAWFDAAGELWVGAYAAVFELPDELRRRLNEECDPAECLPDPRLVCAATDEVAWVSVPPRIDNALRGDLIMSPGDGTGLIGSILENLDPRQHFDHMGIMVRDHDLVRHATMAHERLKRRDPGRFMTGTFFGDSAPANGFHPDGLTYGWPGTITQSVEDAFFTGFNTTDPARDAPYNAQGDYFALNPGVTRLPRPADDAQEEDWEEWREQQRFADPEYPGDKPFAIHNFPLGPAYRMDTGEVIHPVVVKPSPALVAIDPRIRGVLHRVAAAAEGLHGHYRFYAYTDARIALDASYRGPGGTWCAGTLPVVCSSFVWAAIQLLNARSPQQVEVEGRATEHPAELLPVPFVDGLYRYQPAERKKAGRALHALVAEMVRREVYFEVQRLEHENRLAVDLSQIGLAALVTLLAGPAAAAAALLGVTPSTIVALKLAIEDMPDNLATQMCNTFAADRADERNVELWAAPGEGVAVSPDDIKEFWDPPNLASNAERWHGLYGTTERMLLIHRRHEPRRIHRLERSAGPARVHGRVLYQGQPVAAARVRFGCDTTMTVPDRTGPAYRLQVPAGRYEAVATAYWPATQELLTGRTLVEVEAGDQAEPVDLTLEDPPEWRRLVVCRGRISVVRRVYIGTDDWAHSPVNLELPLILAPDTWGQPPAQASTRTAAPGFVSRHAQRFNVRVDLVLELHEDLSVEVSARSALCEHYYEHRREPTGDEIVTTGEAESRTLRPGERTQFVFDHNSGNAPPDRAHVEFTVENQRAPA